MKGEEPNDKMDPANIEQEHWENQDISIIDSFGYKEDDPFVERMIFTVIWADICLQKILRQEEYHLLSRHRLN